MKSYHVSEKKRFSYTTISSFVLQILTLVSGFILPHLILVNYGSEVNGLISSISKFLMFVSIMDLGVGAVVRTSFYKPLMDKDMIGISMVYSSSTKYFRTIACIMLVYIAGLCFVYPLFIRESFSRTYTIILILFMSISSFMQFYFGISNSLLLDADQRGYIRYNIQSIALVADFLLSYILIFYKLPIHIVKLSTSIVYASRPIILEIYVKKNYQISKSIKYDVEPIKQKWNGFAQHLSTFIMDYADIGILTILSTLINVSIYSVYHMVLIGVNGIFVSLMTGIKSLLGREWAKDNPNNFRKLYSFIEWVLHTAIVLVYGTTVVLIVPFIRVYTFGLKDANYIHPFFGFLLTLAFAFNMLRSPSSMLIQATGMYKETQICFLWCAFINVVISVLAVKKFGLVGVAFGTIAAMFIQMIWTSFFCYKKIIQNPIKGFIKQLVADLIIFIFGIIICHNFLDMESKNYMSWIILAIQSCFIWISVSVFINLLLFKFQVLQVLTMLQKKSDF